MKEGDIYHQTYLLGSSLIAWTLHVNVKFILKMKCRNLFTEFLNWINGHHPYCLSVVSQFYTCPFNQNYVGTKILRKKQSWCLVQVKIIKVHKVHPALKPQQNYTAAKLIFLKKGSTLKCNVYTRNVWDWFWHECRLTKRRSHIRWKKWWTDAITPILFICVQSQWRKRHSAGQLNLILKFNLAKSSFKIKLAIIITYTARITV